MLTYSSAADLLRRAGIVGDVSLTLIKRENDVYRIDCGSDSYFLKTYTKSWYGTNPLDTAFNVQHERAAWDILRGHGLAAPDVVLADTTPANPLERPFILTRQLAGAPLVDLLMLADDAEFAALLRLAGVYLRAMHAATFNHPGYLDSPTGPSTPPDPSGWQHRCWSPDQRQKNALAYLAGIQALLSPKTAKRLEWEFSTMAEVLRTDYHPPRFTHGDCHAHQFFFKRDGDDWDVTGVVDMEVSSAGDCGEDWLKLGIELASHFAPSTQWWKSVFAGYGVPPDFQRLRLRLLGAEPAEYGLSAVNERLIRGLLDARDWTSLFAAIYEVA
jgi:aminoglycoside phosphotransferase (APT) family kinase protein